MQWRPLELAAFELATFELAFELAACSGRRAAKRFKGASVRQRERASVRERAKLVGEERRACACRLCASVRVNSFVYGSLAA
eukprot:1721828-Pleurochrysis_carterae.AAC.1